jgi:TonB-linked SusC/RagA family outer membrane protein
MQLAAIFRLFSWTGIHLTPQIHRVMKLSAVFLFALCIQVSARIDGQTVTLDLTNAPVQKVFKEVSRQTGISIIYNEALFKGLSPVTIKVRDVTIGQVLDLCLKNQPFTYAFDGNLIQIIKKPAPANGSVTDIPAASPPNDIHGRVTDSLGNPLAGASVTVKGSKKGTSTDTKGNFELKNVDDNATIIISYSGFSAREFRLSNNPELKSGELTVVLQRNNSSLDQVQIIAYGTTTERLNTGDVTTVKSEEIEKQPVSNVLAALDGLVPGLFITQQSGMPGSAFTVQIRGQNSISNGNDPFYLIDGVPYTSELIQNSSLNPAQGNPLDFINPSDIESVSVLKDADATAIYGSRAANGAILITTKKGKAGKLKLDLNASQGIGQAPLQAKWLNTSHYLQMRNEAFFQDGLQPNQGSAPDLLLWDTTRYTNWQKVLIGNAAEYTDIGGNVSGGNPNTQYLVGANYHRETSVFPNSGADEKIGLHVNLSSSSDDQRFKINVTGNYLVNDRHLLGQDLTPYDDTPPDAPTTYNPDGTLNWANSTFQNPLALTQNRYAGNTNNLVGNALLSYNVIKGLYIKSSFGYTYMQTDEFSTTPIASQNPAYSPTGSAYFSDNNIHSWIAEPMILYTFLLNRSHFEVLGGSTFEENSTNGQSLEGSGYTSDALLQSVLGAPVLHIASVTNATYKYNALFGRVNYNYSEKYIVNLNWRRDGSSRFGPNNQFHNFGSVGAGWIFTKEDFFPKGVLSYGKLRVSYGTTGNDQIGDYQFYNLYQSSYFPYQGTTALTPTGLSNPNLAWELTKKFEGGMNLGFAKDRVLLEASYYYNRSSNQLLGAPLPSITGFESIPLNFPATVQNSGWEFSLNSTNINRRDFRWKTSLNLTIGRNKLAAFPDLAQNPSYKNTYVIGRPVTGRELYHCIGVDPQTGVYQFADSNGKATFTPNYLTDRTAFVNLAPKYFGGFLNTFVYKRWQLDMSISFRKQTAVNPLFQHFGAPGMFAINNLQAVMSRWQNPGDKTNVERFTTSFASPAFSAYTTAQQSDIAYTDGSFIRLNNVSLSYKFSQSLLRNWGVQSLELYLHGQNLLMITSFKGGDPETLGDLPVLKYMTGGIRVSL